jgi:outer membrane receptor protein involved in Fe transport
MKSTITKAATLLLLLSLSVFAYGQGEKGSISGTVTDASNAVIHGATITVTAVGTGAVRTATTNDSGFYSVTNLAPGSYDVKVAASGFADTVRRFSVAPGVAGTLDVTTALQGSREVVEVTGQVQTQVDTQTSTISEVVSSKRVSELPTLTRDPYDFVQTIGNVNQDSASGTGGKDEVVRGAGVSVNGQRSAGVDILLDGGENVDLYTTKVGQSVPLDAVQEFSVATSNYSAEYGRSSGGVINVATKSGSNDFHGSLYEFNRVSALTTNDYESNANGTPKGKYTRNQFGYSIGGPILKNKLFFFSSTEWQRVRSNANVRVVIPDDAFIAAAAPATQGFFNAFGVKRPGLRVTQRLNAIDAQLCDANLSNPCAGFATPLIDTYGRTNPMLDIVDYFTPSDAGGGAPQNNYSTLWRVDYQLSDKTTLFGRYALFNQTQFDGFLTNSPYVGYDTGQTNFNNNAMFSLTHIFTPNVISESKVVFNRLNNQQPLGPNPVGPTLYMNSNFNPTVLGNPFEFPGYSATTPGNSIPFGGPQNVVEFSQAVSWNHGNHQFRFGGQYIYTRDNRTFGAYQNAIEAFDDPNGNTGAMEAFLGGTIGRFQVVIDPQGKFPCSRDEDFNVVVTPECSINLPATQPSFARSNRYNDFAFYGQDTWKIRPRLTLSLGLRYEYYGVQHNKDASLDSNFVFGTGNDLFSQIRNGRVFTVDPTANSPASPVGGLWEPDWNNLAPRVGFAWDATGDGKTSLRGGYGISYERNFGNVTFNVIQNPPAQFNSVFNPGGNITTDNLGPFTGTGTKSLPPPSLRYVRQDIPTAYTQSWNLSVQRELRQNTVMSLDYTGAHGLKEYSIENLNQTGFGVLYLGTDPTAHSPLDRLNRQYGNMNTRGANGFSHYNALNVRLVSNNLFHQGLDILTNYTWSHSIDNLSSSFSETPQTINLGLLDPFQPGLDKGSADFDSRHRIAISAVWDLPYARNTKGFMKQVLDGWQFAPILTARTGNPFTVFDTTGFNGFDTVFGRYIPSGAIQTEGTSDGALLGNNVFQYIHLPDPVTYFEPLTGSGELPTCDTTTNGAGNLVSTGQNCRWPSNMVGRNTFRGPGAYNINLSIAKTFPITERFRLQFRSEFYNLLNHSNYYVQSGASADASIFTPGQGFDLIGKRGLNPAPGIPNERRFIQMALKLIF